MSNELATFAGGCFWCMEHPFDALNGVIETIVGYTGGNKINPTYEEVCTGKTGHVEAIQVHFDPEKIDYEALLNVYWHNIDPTRSEGQFCDIGTPYKPIIFYHNERQKELAEKSKKTLLRSMPILVDILPAKAFYPAEEYHQKYYKKSPKRYEFYSAHSGRKERLKELWGKDV